MIPKIVEIDTEKCTGCGLCVRICPRKILYIENKECKVSNQNQCDKLAGCEIICPANAIKIN